MAKPGLPPTMPAGIRTMKKCTKCAEVKPVSEFHKDKRRPNGLSSRCIQCKRDANNNYNRLNPSIARERSRAWYWNNKDRASFYLKTRAETPHGRFMQYKGNASWRGIKFSLSEEQFSSFWKLPCDYCGGNIRLIGLDRVDNCRGYEIGNVVPCCARCNKAKLDMSRDEFLAMCMAVSARHKGMVNK